MANHMKEVAEILGVELGEEFYIKELATDYDEDIQKLLEDGLYWHDRFRGWYHAPRGMLEEFLVGRYTACRKRWKPIKSCKPLAGEKYFVPYIANGEVEYKTYVWGEDASSDENRFTAGLVCRDEIDAIDMAENMIEVIRGHKDLI